MPYAGARRRPTRGEVMENSWSVLDFLPLILAAIAGLLSSRNTSWPQIGIALGVLSIGVLMIIPAESTTENLDNFRLSLIAMALMFLAVAFLSSEFARRFTKGLRIFFWLALAAGTILAIALS